MAARMTGAHFKPTINMLASKLSKYVTLSDDDKIALATMSNRVRRVPARGEIMADGERPEYIHLVLSGWACRSKTLPSSGARQITAILLPGDMVDLYATILGHMDHALEAISDVEVALIQRRELDILKLERPHLFEAFLWSTLVDEGILRAWIVNNGRRSATERIAHLLCELRERLENVGLASKRMFPAPLSQIDLADVAGLTPVHVNRVFKQLRESEVVSLSKRHVMIHDLTTLHALADYDGSYLHTTKREIEALI